MRPRKKNIQLTALELAPFARDTLSVDHIRRIEAYKKILGDADSCSVDDAIRDFCRDRNIEKEIKVWERIAHVFKHFIEGHKITDRDRRREVLRILLQLSMTSKVPESDSLTRDELNELRYNF